MQDFKPKIQKSCKFFNMKSNRFFKHDSLAKTIWRIGRRKLLKEIFGAGLKLKSEKSNQLKRVNLETTVPLRQNYNRNAKKLLLKVTWLKQLGPML